MHLEHESLEQERPEQMPLQQLARQIVKINKRATATPVLVTPSFLSLQPPFFAALAVELAGFQRCSIRFDWYREIPGTLDLGGYWLDRRKASQVNRVLRGDSRRSGIDAAIQLTATIGRPAKSASHFLVGISTDELDLPAWTTAVRLGTTAVQRQGASPEQVFHLQSPKLAGAA
jgi:hypothetical protein